METFSDLDHPQCVEAVDPADVSAVFGEKISLEGISAEITDEPVTWDIGKVLTECGKSHWLLRQTDIDEENLRNER